MTETNAAQAEVVEALQLMATEDREGNAKRIRQLADVFRKRHAYAMARVLEGWLKGQRLAMPGAWDRRPMGKGRSAQLDRYVNPKANVFSVGRRMHHNPNSTGFETRKQDSAQEWHKSTK